MLKFNFSPTLIDHVTDYELLGFFFLVSPQVALSKLYPQPKRKENNSG